MHTSIRSFPYLSQNVRKLDHVFVTGPETVTLCRQIMQFYFLSRGLSLLWVIGIAIVGICRYCTLMFLVLIEFYRTLGSLYREARSILLLLSEKRLVLCFLNMSFFSRSCFYSGEYSVSLCSSFDPVTLN